MRKLLRVVLPPIVVFLLYAVVVKYHEFYVDKAHDTDNSVVEDLITYFRYVSPLFFVVTLITQLIIAIPVWRTVIVKTASAKIIAFVLLVLLCFSISLGISYVIWDKLNGLSWLINTSLILTGIQMTYWLINMLILLGLHKSSPAVQNEQAEKGE